MTDNEFDNFISQRHIDDMNQYLNIDGCKKENDKLIQKLSKKIINTFNLNDLLFSMINNIHFLKKNCEVFGVQIEDYFFIYDWKINERSSTVSTWEFYKKKKNKITILTGLLYYKKNTTDVEILDINYEQIFEIRSMFELFKNTLKNIIEKKIDEANQYKEKVKENNDYLTALIDSDL